MRFLLALLLLLPLATRADDTFVCVGNEPFWRFDIAGEAAEFTSPNWPAARFRGELTRLTHLKLAVWRGRTLQGSRDLVAWLEARVCADTMADRRFPLTVRVSLPMGELLAGCCAVGPELPSETGDWSRRIADLLPAIDACLAARPGTRVAVAWPMAEGKAGMRLLGDAIRFDCVAGADGVEVLDEVAGLDRLPGERQPLFTRAPDPPPEGGCYATEEARAGDERIGWFSYDVC